MHTTDMTFKVSDGHLGGAIGLWVVWCRTFGRGRLQLLDSAFLFFIGAVIFGDLAGSDTSPKSAFSVSPTLAPLSRGELVVCEQACRKFVSRQ